MNVKRFQELFNKLAGNVNTVIHGKEDVVRLALVAICAQGHVVFEDVPGVGKSMLARALSASMNADTAFANACGCSRCGKCPAPSIVSNFAPGIAAA